MAIIDQSVSHEDTDFIGFTFNGKHSVRDLKISRTNDGDMY
jgi:hypothetical protein